MKQPCPPCDHLNVSLLLRFVLLGELLCADEAQLLALAHAMQQCGLLQLATEADASTAAVVRVRKATRQTRVKDLVLKRCALRSGTEGSEG